MVDVELVKKAINGDKEAFEKIIVDVKDVLYRLAKARLGCEDDIYDAISETAYIAFTNIKNLKHPEYFQTWIIKILLHEISKIYSRGQSRLNIFERIKQTYTIEYNSTYKVESSIDFDKMISNLKYDEKVIFILYFYSGYNTTEIAKILGKSTDTVKSKLRRGKEKLFKLYKGGVEYDK